MKFVSHYVQNFCGIPNKFSLFIIIPSILQYADLWTIFKPTAIWLTICHIAVVAKNYLSGREIIVKFVRF